MSLDANSERLSQEAFDAAVKRVCHFYLSANTEGTAAELKAITDNLTSVARMAEFFADKMCDFEDSAELPKSAGFVCWFTTRISFGPWGEACRANIEENWNSKGLQDRGVVSINFRRLADVFARLAAVFNSQTLKRIDSERASQPQVQRIATMQDVWNDISLKKTCKGKRWTVGNSWGTTEEVEAWRRIRYICRNLQLRGRSQILDFVLAEHGKSETEFFSMRPTEVVDLLCSPNWSRFRTVDEWLKVLKQLGEDISDDTFLRRRKMKAVPTYRQNPDSSRSSISLAIDDLPGKYSDEMTV